MKTTTLLRSALSFAAALGATALVSQAATQPFDFKDPKGVNNVQFKLDAPLESITGTATGISGNILFDAASPGATTGRIVLDTASFTVGNPVMADHLKGANWLDVAKYPTITFEATKVANTRTQGAQVLADVSGKLTVKGVTKDVTVPVTFTHLADKLGARLGDEKLKGDLLVVRTQFQINRNEYDLQPAIASDPQGNVDFYTGLLGLRLVKKTVNFDDPSAYHLYYGDETGSPGSIVTFFYWPGGAGRGRVGTGQVTRLSFSVPADALDFWIQRLERHQLLAKRETRFGEEVVAFADPDGIAIELVAVSEDSRAGWTGAGITSAHAIRGLHTTEITVREAAPTEKIITKEMGYRLVKRDGSRARFEAGAGGSGRYIDVIATHALPTGLGGVGTIHHIAFRVAGDEDELLMQTRLADAGYSVSAVRDRNYFRSIYYRENGGVLFEIATDVPGFPDDEPVGSLGTALKLPVQFERFRKEIEAALPALQPARAFA